MFYVGKSDRKRLAFFHFVGQCFVSRDNIKLNIELREQHTQDRKRSDTHSFDTESSAVKEASSLCVNEETNIIRSELN